MRAAFGCSVPNRRAIDTEQLNASLIAGFKAGSVSQRLRRVDAAREQVDAASRNASDEVCERDNNQRALMIVPAQCLTKPPPDGRRRQGTRDTRMIGGDALAMRDEVCATTISGHQ